MTIDAAQALHANASGSSHGNAFGVAHASTDAKPNREAIPERSRGLRRFAATPGHAPHTVQTPTGSPRKRP
jgi:hypothetical protein